MPPSRPEEPDLRLDAAHGLASSAEQRRAVRAELQGLTGMAPLKAFTQLEAKVEYVARGGDPRLLRDGGGHGHSYERSAIERWLATKSTSPMTGEALVHSFLAPNHTLRRMIREWQQARACKSQAAAAGPARRRLPAGCAREMVSSEHGARRRAKIRRKKYK
ncbi:hypothetical protein EMIHUDRAFT_241449 [Emiliania huxleyi CCMP1516]|uniref:U-box domain-containing protein n=2 Tax=Emiliania huxleyi TaxID=2903 RepID=A0A0D3JCM5_EMIH1|nr:hypothetical protein EMIHUDRAFT_241449 [Emiliania huxleyi CCMP1516]EOD21260.1 hypothetical protein EMIHUDRAFT_241449 [Emiliania huxleyi CCMP1516]|eukprot:XP_005773689.1 hypothetical protein EMIHUDRAFT_241449 [Emiliania huxleyi CCMP1516]